MLKVLVRLHGKLRRLRKRAAAWQYKLYMLENYDKSVFGETLGTRPTTPCHVDHAEHASRLRTYRKVAKALSDRREFRQYVKLVQRCKRRRHTPLLVILHKCDNKMCSNPEHITYGTYGDNSRDALLKGIPVRGGMGELAVRREEARAKVDGFAREIASLICVFDALGVPQQVTDEGEVNDPLPEGEIGEQK